MRRQHSLDVGGIHAEDSTRYCSDRHAQPMRGSLQPPAGFREGVCFSCSGTPRSWILCRGNARTRSRRRSPARRAAGRESLPQANSRRATGPNKYDKYGASPLTRPLSLLLRRRDRRPSRRRGFAQSFRATPGSTTWRRAEIRGRRRRCARSSSLARVTKTTEIGPFFQTCR